MRPIKNKWPRSQQNDMVMFCAQLMRAMVSAESYESFRAFSLDTRARLTEMIFMLDDVIEGRIPPISLDPVTRELEWSLERDSIARSLAPNEINGFSAALRDQNKKDLRLFRYHCKYILNTISLSYIKTTESEIKRLVGTNNKDNVRRVLSNYCASLINSGLSKPHILKIVNKIFFEKDLLQLGLRSLDRLFREIGSGQKNYNVYCPFDIEIAKYLSRVLKHEVFRIDDFDTALVSELKKMPSFNEANAYLQVKVYEYDAFEAARYVDRHFNNFQAITFLARRGVDFQWPVSKYVAKPGAKKGDVISNQPLSLQQKSPPSGRVFKNFRGQIDQIYNCFEPSSTERLLSAINTAALARSSQSVENQLISLWSAFEVLLSEPQKNQARVVHYVDLLVPCVAIRYVRRYIVAICDELTAGYGTKFRKILQQLPDDLGIDQYTRFTHLVFDEQHAPLRTRLFSLCTENPLACNRIWKLHKDFASADALLKGVRAYEDRIAWQLHRIYRARNGLVHAGKTPSYLETLVMNSFEYFRSCVTSILFRAKNLTEVNIDAAVAEISIRQIDYKTSIGAMGAKKIDINDFDYVYRH